MTRPLARHGIAQLEELFAASWADDKTLKNLEAELRYRQVPRAVSLLAQVQGALYSGPTARLPDAPRISKPVPIVQKATTPNLATGSPPSMTHPPVSPSTEVSQMGTTQPRVPAVSSVPPAAKLPETLTPSLSVAAAYQVLKANPGSTWEAIEQMRRQLVHLAHPDRVVVLSPEMRAEAQAVAKKANAAYAVLRQARGS